jgi:hypothetical protein
MVADEIILNLASKCSKQQIRILKWIASSLRLWLRCSFVAIAPKNIFICRYLRVTACSFQLL